jgi:hypothetical protein
MPGNISKINGLDIDAASAQYVAAGNVDGPLGYNSITSASAALTASYIDPAFISASAAAYGFGSGGGGSTTAQTASYALSISSSTAAADVSNRIALLSSAGTANILQNSNLSYNPLTNKLRVIGGQFEATGITGSFNGTINNATSSSFASTASYLNDLNQNVTINGNLTVFGTASYTNVSSSELNIGTNIITVNTSNPTTRFGGLAVIDSGSSPRTSGSILFDSVNDQWIFIHNTNPLTSSVFIQSPQTYNDLGNEINLTTNRLPKSVNAEHIGDSNISDNGTIVSINSNTQVTGSLLVTAGITGGLTGTASWASNAVLATSASVLYGTDGVYNLVYVKDSQGGKQLFMHPSSTTGRIDTNTGHVLFTAITASFITSSFSGNLTGTASYATQALTASYALSSAGVAGGVTSITAGDGISVDQSTGNVTITNTGGGGGGTNLGLVYAVSLGYLMP